MDGSIVLTIAMVAMLVVVVGGTGLPGQARSCADGAGPRLRPTRAAPGGKEA
jgi:hypothetical protein